MWDGVNSWMSVKEGVMAITMEEGVGEAARGGSNPSIDTDG